MPRKISRSPSYIITKLKFLLSGKYFWLRSVGSSAADQLIQNIIGCISLYYGILPFDKVVEMILPLYLIQISFVALLSFPGSFITNLLKRLEGGNITDVTTDFNPFKFKVDRLEQTENVAF